MKGTLNVIKISDDEMRDIFAAPATEWDNEIAHIGEAAHRKAVSEGRTYDAPMLARRVMVAAALKRFTDLAMGLLTAGEREQANADNTVGEQFRALHSLVASWRGMAASAGEFDTAGETAAACADELERALNV